jgi:hypothetical protein
MGVDYENLLPGNRRVALLSLVQGQERIPALIQAIEFLMSDSE